MCRTDANSTVRYQTHQLGWRDLHAACRTHGAASAPQALTDHIVPPATSADVVLPRRDAIAVERSITEELGRYHNLDGAGNGSGLPGPQLSPGVKDVAEQKAFIAAVAARVARDPDVWYAPSPQNPVERDASRAKLAALRREEVSKYGRPKIEAMVATIADPEIRKLTSTAFAEAPKEFWTEPSSSSGKHHPADEINPGGLAYHAARTGAMADILCEHFGVSGRERDIIFAAALLHDIQKGGRPWKGYAPDHGPIGGAWLHEVWPDNETTRRLQALVHNHMAQWNKPEATPPRDLANQIVSYADYIGAQDTVFLQLPVSSSQ